MTDAQYAGALPSSVVSGGSGTHATRPTPTTTSPQLYYEENTGLAYMWDGTTWQLLKPGSELGYASITSDFSTTSTTPVDVTGLSVTVTVGVRPIEVIVSGGQLQMGTAGDGILMLILEDGTQVQQTEVGFGSTNECYPCSGRVRRNPAAGAHTYKVQLQAVIGGTAKIGAGANHPASIQVIEV